MSEDWLYDKTLRKIEELHSSKLKKIIDYRQKIRLPLLEDLGTGIIQIDIVAYDPIKKIIILAECKNFLSLQGVSECGEQLFMKSHILKNYPPSPIGKDKIDFKTFNSYRTFQYVSLGSHDGKKYNNAKCSSKEKLEDRFNFYSGYLKVAGKGYMGLIMFLNRTSKISVAKKGKHL